MFDATFNFHVSDQRIIWNAERWQSANQLQFSIQQLFQLQIRLPKLCRSFVKISSNNYGFLSKSLKFSDHRPKVLTIQFCSNFTSMQSKHVPNNVGRDFRLPTCTMLAFAMVARKSFNSKFIAKIHFPIGHFMLPINNAAI